MNDLVGQHRLACIWARLRPPRCDLINPTFAVLHGRIVKRTGDGSNISKLGERPPTVLTLGKVWI